MGVYTIKDIDFSTIEKEKIVDDKTRALQYELFATGDKQLQYLAICLSNPKYQSGRREYILKKKLFNLLSLMIDETSFNLLKEADKKINKIVGRLISQGGWFASRYGITKIDNEEETIERFPKEIEDGVRLYHLDRDENGYHLQNNIPKPDTIGYLVRETEKRYLKEKEIDLTILHQLYSIKERIMCGGYELVSAHYARLVELICEYFGYEKLKEKVPTKK